MTLKNLMHNHINDGEIQLTALVVNQKKATAAHNGFLAQI
jgi:hypothetical protein